MSDNIYSVNYNGGANLPSIRVAFPAPYTPATGLATCAADVARACRNTRRTS
jgi:hypothetical protein